MLELIYKHAQEINQLYQQKNKHYIIETGDLLVLCLELIKESKGNTDFILDKCYARYDHKLKFLIEEYKKKKRKNNHES